MPKVLIVDDERSYRDYLGRFLAREGHEVQLAATGREAIDGGCRFRPDVLVVDWMLKDHVHGLQVTEAFDQSRVDRDRFVVATRQRVDGGQDSVPVRDRVGVPREIGPVASLLRGGKRLVQSTPLMQEHRPAICGGGAALRKLPGQTLGLVDDLQGLFLPGHSIERPRPFERCEPLTLFVPPGRVPLGEPPELLGRLCVPPTRPQFPSGVEIPAGAARGKE